MFVLPILGTEFVGRNAHEVAAITAALSLQYDYDETFAALCLGGMSGDNKVRPDSVRVAKALVNYAESVS